MTMVRLSSHDASLLMDVLEQPEESHRLLANAKPVVQEIGKALINPSEEVGDSDVKEAVHSIRRWAEESKRSDDQHSFA